MNIQFMTAERNGVYTKDSYTGEPKMVYLPDFDEMIKNASCEEEADAIKEIKRKFAEDKKGIFTGFAFEIVYMDYREEWDFEKGWTGRKTWQMLQHPWYQNYKGEHTATKEEMIKDIEKMLEAERR